MVKTGDFRSLLFLEVTTHCITNLARQLGNRVRFGKNGFSEGARDETSLLGIFNHENQFIHRRLSQMTGGPFFQIMVRPLGNVQPFLDRQEKLDQLGRDVPSTGARHVRLIFVLEGATLKKTEYQIV